MSENSKLFEAITSIIDAWKASGPQSVDSLQHAEQLHMTFPDIPVEEIRQSMRDLGRDAGFEVE